MNRFRALAGRIREELGAVRRTVSRAGEAAARALSSGDEAYWDAVALNLHAFYTGVERVLEAIAREVDEAVPVGPEWHRDLLLQMAAELPGRRPAVLARETWLGLDDYRGFRHLVRNLYPFSLRPSRLRELAEGLPECYGRVEADLEAFLAFLLSPKEGEDKGGPSPSPGV